jgi:hypothetical protein
MLIVGSQVGSSVNENVQVIINEPGAVLAIVDVSVFQLIENFGMLQTAGGHIENLNNNPGGMVFVDGILTVGQVINEGAISVSDLGSFGSIGVGNDFLLFQSAAGKLFNEGLVTNLNETSVSPRIRGGEIHGNGEFQIGFVASRLVPETNMSFHPTTNDNGFRSRQDSEFVFELGKDLIQIVGSGLEFLDLQGSVCFEGEVQVGEYQLFEFSMADSSEEAIGISLENVPDGLSAELLRLSSGLWVSVDVEVLLGDVNMDGMVDLLDIAPFVDLLTNLQYQAEADINQDGNVDLLDVTPFVGLLSGS